MLAGDLKNLVFFKSCGEVTNNINNGSYTAETYNITLFTTTPLDYGNDHNTVGVVL